MCFHFVSLYVCDANELGRQFVLARMLYEQQTVFQMAEESLETKKAHLQYSRFL